MAPAILALAQFAPYILKFFNAGEAPTKIVETISGVAKSVSGASTLDEAVSILQNNAEKAYEFKSRMLDVNAQLETEYLKDRQDARNRDIELAKAGYRNVRADILAYGAIAALISVIFLLLFKQVPEGPGRDLLMVLTGTLVAIIKDVYSFEFGTTRSSKEKDVVIGKLVE